METRVRVGIIGDFDGRPSHIATDEALRHCAKRLSIDVEAKWLPTGNLEHDDQHMSGFDAFWCAPGSPYKSMSGAINAIRFVRVNDYPFLGTCGGFQHAVIEYAVSVLGIKGAGHQEITPNASVMVVTALACSLKAQSQSIKLREGSAVREIYGTDVTEERYNCSFGLNPEYQSTFENSGFAASGTDENGDVRIMEIPRKRFYIVTLFQPQLSSTQESPHKLILEYLAAANKFHTEKQ